jgi:F0F1-type ATP synthase membrane subunit b/b'
MTRTEISPEQRRRNVRLAWILAAFALFMLLSSVPFWKGLFNMFTSGAQ